jgi:hypothetical protein
MHVSNLMLYYLFPHSLLFNSFISLMQDEFGHYPYQGVGEFMSAMGWTSCEGGPSNVVPSEPPNPVALPPNPSAVPPRQARKKVCVRRKNPNFFPNEDIMLVKSYLEVSCDPVVNTNQKRRICGQGS